MMCSSVTRMVCQVVLLVACGVAQGASRADEMVVTAAPLAGPAEDLGRSVEVVDAAALQDLGAVSVGDALEGLTSVSVSERGASGVQADLSLRGSTFQQVLVTLDGIPLADPQTAHHNMDLPMPIQALDSIVVIPGPGSALFGPSAFAGVVDLTPRHPTDSGQHVVARYGSFETWRLSAVLDRVVGNHAGTLAASYSQSDGFQDGTDYETVSVWGSSVARFAGGTVRLSAGHTDKDFGAKDFYATYPSREMTEVTVVDVAPMLDIGSGWTAKAVARYRRHRDEFILIEDDPDYYRNLHRSESFTERMTVTSPTSVLGAAAVGVERSDSILRSSNMGNREAAIMSGFVQHRVSGDMWGADVGVRVDDHDNWGTEVSPSVALRAHASEQVRLRAVVGRGIRPPSFTELYYTDPKNAGNAELDPEEAWGGEVGVSIGVADGVDVTAVYFRSEAENVIDWVRASSDDAWDATNIGETTTEGAEIGVVVQGDGVRVMSDYRYTDVDAESGGMESKYALNVPEHDAGVRVAMQELAGYRALVSLRYRDVPTLDAYWLVGLKVSKTLGAVTVYVSGRNLLDDEYEEIPGVPTAGAYGEIGLEAGW